MHRCQSIRDIYTKVDRWKKSENRKASAPFSKFLSTTSSIDFRSFIVGNTKIRQTTSVCSSRVPRCTAPTNNWVVLMQIASITCHGLIRAPQPCSNTIDIDGEIPDGRSISGKLVMVNSSMWPWDLSSPALNELGRN